MKKKYLLLIPILFILSFAVRVYALGSGLDYTVVFEHDVDSKFKNFLFFWFNPPSLMKF